MGRKKELLMIALSTLLPFVGAVIVLSITPGPDLLLLVSRGMAQGWKASWFTAFGFTLAGIVQIPLLALGVASLVQSSPVAFDVLRYAGAAYLIWRGVSLLRSAGTSAHVGMAAATSPVAALRDGVVASLTNPKGLMFLLAFLPQFVDPAKGSVSLQFVLLGLIMKAVALMIESLIAVMSGRVGSLLVRWPKVVLWQERLTSLVLIALGLRLLTMSGQAR